MRETVIILSENEVCAQLMSIGQKEYFAAAQQDLKPSYMFKVRKDEYNDETKLIYDGKPYAIYRTYTKDDFIELYTTEKIGLNYE